LGGDLEKKSRFAGPEIFLRFETDLDFSRPGFSEIKVQIKRPIVLTSLSDFKKIWEIFSNFVPFPLASHNI
jgi:hypothetical protein